jgi:hypothetical protein
MSFIACFQKLAIIRRYLFMKQLLNITFTTIAATYTATLPLSCPKFNPYSKYRRVEIIWNLRSTIQCKHEFCIISKPEIFTLIFIRLETLTKLNVFMNIRKKLDERK